TFDSSGRLYTGNGFSTGGPSATGAVKAFDQASWTAALTGGPAVDFEAEGTLLIEILSASPLGFDLEGNLYAGGGGAGSDFAALVRGSAVTGALGGGGPIDPDDGEAVRRFDPDTSSSTNFYGVHHNDVTGELYVRQFAASTVFVYAVVEPIPAVSDWGMIVMGLSVLVGGTAAFRPRRTDRARVRLGTC
ncbi:MAG: hypothetical protein IIB60_04745, partial [Planctomycetes bacterium]|nr:hypothetical protein [Planctomycetota bacterium]